MLGVETVRVVVVVGVAAADDDDGDPSQGNQNRHLLRC